MTIYLAVLDQEPLCSSSNSNYQYDVMRCDESWPPVILFRDKCLFSCFITMLTFLDTRYFIVKSFNEENVLNCIEDVSPLSLFAKPHALLNLQSIWTTQVQNGSVFKEAFETCKNVILVFSINKSRAFQGYVGPSPPSSDAVLLLKLTSSRREWSLSQARSLFPTGKGQ